MIALTISDAMDADAAILRISELIGRNRSIAVPDAICVRNDTFMAEPFSAMCELVSKLWNGQLVLESDDPASTAKAVLNLVGRKPVLLGANRENIEQFSIIARTFDCPLCISDADIEQLFDLAEYAKDSGVAEILIDPMMKNMKQCLETCNDIKRIKEMMPDIDYKVVVRSWSGEYAMTMASVSALVDDSLIVVDDLDQDCCDTLSALISSIR